MWFDFKICAMYCVAYQTIQRFETIESTLDEQNDTMISSYFCTTIIDKSCGNLFFINIDFGKHRLDKY